MSNGGYEKAAEQLARASRAEAGLDPAFLVQSAALVPGRLRLSQLMLIVLGVAVLLWVGIIFGAAVAAGSFLALLVLAITMSVAMVNARTARRDVLLKVLSIAAAKGLPLGPTASAFADQDQGGLRQRILRLAHHLNQGATLSDSLTAVPRLIAQDGVLLARAGEETNSLPRALATASHSRGSRFPIWLAIAGRFSYVLFILLILQTITSFILYFIVPKFEAIFAGFGVPLPQVSVLIIDLSHWLVRFSPLILVALLFEIVLILFLPSTFASYNKFEIPLFDRLLIRRHSALAARCLALYVAAGRPITAGLAMLARYYPTRWFRMRLKRAAREVEQGMDWVTALRRHEIIRAADAEVLESAQNVGNLAWALEEHADRNERRLAYRLQIVFVTLFPILILAIGFAVFMICLGFFAPLVKLISELA